MSVREAYGSDDDLVVLLDEGGAAIGSAPRLDVHTEATPLHLAFSCYLFDQDGRILLTRRALGKITWPGVWTNSVCGHPKPGEPVEDAIRRRGREELGATIGPLMPALPDFRYRAVDFSGVVENEICPVYIGFLHSDVAPNPDEVMDHQWVAWGDLVEAIAATPGVYSPWAAEQVPQLAPILPRLVAPHRDDAPDVAACVRHVGELLTSEFERLRGTWALHTGEVGVDVLELDLPDWLDRAMHAGGKRFRVTMAYWGFVAAGGRPGGPGYETMVRAAAALETLHLFALIHDDIMDESTSRRGHPTAHEQAAAWHRANEVAVGDADTFGRNLAMLLGDLAHTMADAIIDRLPERLRLAWYDLCLELIVGQRADLTSAAAGVRDLHHAKEVARLKSGAYTVTRPLQLGALAAGASDGALTALLRAGRDIGQAFAYRDDILGVWGDPAVTGKPSGDDLAEGKATVIMALAHEHLLGEDGDRLHRLGTPSMRDDDVEVLQRSIVEAGVRDEVESLITRRMESAAAHLDSEHLTPAGVTGLQQAALDVAWRHQ